MSIYVFSRPVRSGKTTELLRWCDGHENVMGIAMPDIGGSRKIIDLQTKAMFDIECTDVNSTNEPLVSVGRFHFYSKAFEKANTILINALTLLPHWLVIDEAGKLELDRKGFYPAIVRAVDFYGRDNATGNLLITVRESLYIEMTSFFNLRNHWIIHELAELLD